MHSDRKLDKLLLPISSLVIILKNKCTELYMILMETYCCGEPGISKLVLDLER